MYVALIQVRVSGTEELAESVGDNVSGNEIMTYYQHQLDKYQTNHQPPSQLISAAGNVSGYRTADAKPWSDEINSDEFTLPVTNIAVTNIGKYTYSIYRSLLVEIN